MLQCFCPPNLAPPPMTLRNHRRRQTLPHRNCLLPSVKLLCGCQCAGDPKLVQDMGNSTYAAPFQTVRWRFSVGLTKATTSYIRMLLSLHHTSSSLTCINGRRGLAQRCQPRRRPRSRSILVKTGALPLCCGDGEASGGGLHWVSVSLVANQQSQKKNDRVVALVVTLS